MWNKYGKYSLLACFLVGCSHTQAHVHRYKLCVDAELVVLENLAPLEYDAMVIGAIAWWNKQAGRQILVNAKRADILYNDGVPPFMGIYIARDETLDEWDSRERNIGGTTILSYSGHFNNRCISGTTILLRDDGSLSDYDLYRVLLHEMGHGIGLPDSNESGTVMSPYMYRDREIILGTDSMADLSALYPPSDG